MAGPASLTIGLNHTVPEPPELTQGKVPGIPWPCHAFDVLVLTPPGGTFSLWELSPNCAQRLTE